MKVLLATSDNSYTSGAFRSTSYLASELNGMGHECLVLLPRRGDGEGLLDYLGVRHRTVTSYDWVRRIDDESLKTSAKWLAKRLYNHLWALGETSRLAKAESIELVHVCTSYAYVSALAARDLGLPLVWHVREFLEEDQRRRISPGERWHELMSSADRVIAISDAIERKYSAILRPTPVTRVYNGISTDGFEDRDDELFSGEVVKMTMVGSIQERKGQLELVQALALLPDDVLRHVRLSIFGKALDPAYLEAVREAIVRGGLVGKASLEGPTEDPAKAFCGADVAFVCSRNEAFGRVTVEAMMAGCVVIGAGSMGTAEIIDDGETGFLYKPGHPESLARRIMDVLSDAGAAKAVAARGHEKALREFTARKNAEGVARVYEEVLAMRKSRGVSSS